MYIALDAISFEGKNLAFLFTFKTPVTERAVFSMAFCIWSRVSSSSTIAALLLNDPTGGVKLSKPLHIISYVWTNNI